MNCECCHLSEALRLLFSLKELVSLMLCVIIMVVRHEFNGLVKTK